MNTHRGRYLRVEQLIEVAAGEGHPPAHPLITLILRLPASQHLRPLMAPLHSAPFPWLDPTALLHPHLVSPHAICHCLLRLAQGASPNPECVCAGPAGSASPNPEFPVLKSVF